MAFFIQTMTTRMTVNREDVLETTSLGHQNTSVAVPFLRLPTEICLEIYRCLMLHPTHLETYPWGRFESKAPNGTLANNIIPVPLNGGLLRVCRRVHDEASSVLYGENTFAFVCRSPALLGTTPVRPPVPVTYHKLLSHVVLEFYTDVTGPIIPGQVCAHQLRLSLENAPLNSVAINLRRDLLWTHTRPKKSGAGGCPWIALSGILRSSAVPKVTFCFHGFPQTLPPTEVTDFDPGTLKTVIMSAQQTLIDLAKP